MLAEMQVETTLFLQCFHLHVLQFFPPSISIINLLGKDMDEGMDEDMDEEMNKDMDKDSDKDIDNNM